MNVLEAAERRIAWLFAQIPRIYVSFSGGKDSTVLLHLAAAEARRTGRRFGLLFIDWEAQFRRTIEHVERCFDLYADVVDPYWVALPLRTTNACSMIEPEWTCWDESRRNDWVRELPPRAISDPAALPCYFGSTPTMTFEDFVPAFGKWYAQGQLSVGLVGLRTAESLNRWRSMNVSKSTLSNLRWTTYMSGTLYNAYPLFDWSVEDIWTFHGRTGTCHNSLYDLMHQAGLSPSQMRICEPYGDEQRRGLWLYHVLEPETWGKVVARVAGANTGALYASERSAVLGTSKMALPDGHTWQSFAELLLDTMPESTSEHYRNKLATWTNWYRSRGQEIQDSLDGDTGADDVPSWRRVCKVLLRNDYWCKSLCFSPTKALAYERYKKVMKARRARWGAIFR